MTEQTGFSFIELEGIAGNDSRLSAKGVTTLSSGSNPRIVYHTIEAPAHGRDGNVVMRGKLPPYVVIHLLASDKLLSEKVE